MPANNKERVTLYLPPSLIEAYKISAIKQRLSLSQMVEIALVTAAGGDILVAEHKSDDGHGE